jgi:predicted nucleic acid-binding Zn ribbon protein
MSDIEQIGTILSRVLERKNLKRIAQQQSVLDEWERIVGKRIASKTEAMRIRKGQLIIEVVNSLWMQELFFMKEELLDRVHALPGGKDINEIRFIPKRN